MSDAAEAALFSQFYARFNLDDQDARMDALLWAGSQVQAERQLGYVSPQRRAIDGARLAAMAGNAANPIVSTGETANYLTDPGYVFQRARLLRKSGSTSAARALLVNRPPLARPAADAEKWVEEMLVNAKGAASDGDPRTAVAARRGFTGWTLTVKGTPAHSSQVFRDDIGPGAIFEAARMLNEFRTQLGGDPLRTFNPGVALGGTALTLDSTRTRGTAYGKSNIVAEHFMVSGDLRVISSEALADAKSRMSAIAASASPHTSATLTFEDGYPPMAPTPGNRALLAEFDRVSRLLGFGAVGMDNPARAGAADVSFVAATIPQIIDGLGPGGTGGHTVDETVDLRSIPIQIARTAVLLHRITKSTIR